MPLREHHPDSCRRRHSHRSPHHRPGRRVITLLSAVIPSPVADAAHDAAHETAARFRHAAYSVSCPTCHVPAGVLCLARRSIHAARRSLYRQDPKSGLVPLLVGRAR
ncbi:zinc finger domain-containing protein [Streptomyces umbrinus]|uniref:zinc finger domain-containing protein n=1 Tax=Streptomyces umbrinus TaxID=67370 RepID=UPI003C2CA414